MDIDGATDVTRDRIKSGRNTSGLNDISDLEEISGRNGSVRTLSLRGSFGIGKNGRDGGNKRYANGFCKAACR